MSLTRLDLPSPVRRPAPARRPVRVFAAAEYNRLLADWRGGLISADLELQCDLRTLRARSRQLIRDNPHAAGFVRAMEDNVAGPDGMTLYPRIRRDDDSLDTDANRVVKDAWRWWGQPGVCTVDGGLSFVDVLRLAVATVAGDGEFLALHRFDARNPFGYALQVLDPDLLDDTYNVRLGALPDERQIVMGVELDRDGRAIAYHLLKRHPADGARERVRVEAKYVVHAFRRRRPGQSRGIPLLTPSMVRLKMLDAWEEAHIVAARVSAAKFWGYKETEPALDDGGDPDAPKSEDRLRVTIEPGLGEVVPHGYEEFFHDPKFPTTSYAEFQKAALREIASGLGVAYNTFANDLEGVNYSSIRSGVIHERDSYRGWHRWLESAVCLPVYRAWLRAAITIGAVRVPPRPLPMLEDAQFQGRGWDWVDPSNDVQAFAIELALGINSRQRAARARGRDMEDVLREINEENELAAEWEVALANPALTGARPTPEDSDEEAADAGAAAQSSRPSAAADDDAADRAHDAGGRRGRVRLVRGADLGRDLVRS